MMLQKQPFVEQQKIKQKQIFCSTQKNILYMILKDKAKTTKKE